MTDGVGRDGRDGTDGRTGHERSWTFLTNHGHVLLAIAADPDLRLRDVAARVGITERAAQRIVGELAEAGYVEVTRRGRRNVYRVQPSQPLRHAAERHHRVGELLQALAHDRAGAPSARARRP